MEKEIIRRKIISEETKNKIAELYSTKEVTSKQALADMFGITKKRCAEILVERNIQTINPWDRTKVIPIIEGDKYIPTEEYTFIAKHRETGVEFKDFNNVCGRLTSYQMDLHPETENPTLIFKKRYYQRTANYWYEQFYDIIQVPIIKKKMKGELYDSDIDEMVRLYETGEVKMIHDLGAMFKITGTRVSRILKENGVEIRKAGGQKKEFRKKKVEPIKPTGKYIETNNIVYRAVCKKTGLEFDDYMNDSGVLSRHLRNEYSDIKINRSRVNIRYFIITGNYWYEEYFDILPFPRPEIRKCDYCDWEMPIDVSARQYKMHLTMQHNISIREHLEKYPKDNDLFKDDFDKFEEEKDDDNWIDCAICGQRMKIVNHFHLKKVHNISVSEYVYKYGRATSNNTHKKLSDIAIKTNESGVCFTPVSKAEKEIQDYLIDLGLEVKPDRKILKGKEIDILIENKKLGIEYNGCHWHSESCGKDKEYHIDKTMSCNEQGYGLIHIFEDEFTYKKDLVLNTLKHTVNKTDDLPILTDFEIKEIDDVLEKQFLNKYHINSYTDSGSTVSYGAFSDNKFVGVMSFKVLNKNMSEYELTRFASNYKYVCKDVEKILLNKFISDFKPNSITTYLDIKWIVDKNNNLYTGIDFKLVEQTEPEILYCSSTLSKDPNDKLKRYNKSEVIGVSQEKLEKCDRIWDCGLFKYRLDLNN